jgi:Fe2+ or Zn2+ uptake regulation protein
MIKNQTDLKKVGLKETKGRNEVLKLLQTERTPVDVALISAHLKKSRLFLNCATIYRILRVFCQKGIAKRIEFQEGKFRYELNRDDHHHLICEGCGKIEDISYCPLTQMENQIKHDKNFIIKRHAFEIFGVCKQCQS